MEATPVVDIAVQTNTHHASHGGAEDQEERCDIPALPECCRALVSCSLSLGFEARESAHDLLAVHGCVSTGVDVEPASTNSSPEPPPPKA
jgi:hypothetical protein